MKKDKNIIEDIIKDKLTGYSPSVDPGQWELLSKSLPKKNFLHWNLKGFNIYYAIVVAVITVSIVTAWFISQDNDNINVSPVTPEIKTMPVIEDTVPVQRKINTPSRNRTSNTENINDAGNQQNLMDTVAILPVVIPVDPVPVIIPPKDSIGPPQPMVQPKSGVKRDTVYKVDTLRVKRRARN